MAAESEKFLRAFPEEFLETDNLLWTDAVDPEKIDLETLYAKAEKYCRRHRWRVGPQQLVVDEPKLSCILRGDEVRGDEVNSYLQLGEKATYGWSVMPEVEELGEQLFGLYCDEAGSSYDYCLVNLYLGPNDRLGWHADREAGDTSIVSVSLGAAREFGVRPKQGAVSDAAGAESVPLSMLVSGGRSARRVGPVTYLALESGDVVVMKPGAQERMEHRVCQGKKGDGWRINLTFRQDR